MKRSIAGLVAAITLATVISLGPTAAAAAAAATGVPPGSFTFAYGTDVEADAKVQVEAAMPEANAFFLAKLGTTVTVPVAVYVSADPVWMTDAYLKQTGQGKQFRKGKLEDFKRCNGGEAHYGAIFMCLTSDVFSKDWFGSGLAAQRTFALTHEYFHNLQFQLGGKGAQRCCTGNDNSLLLLGPQWLVEGSAEYMAFRILGDSNRMDYKSQMAWQLQSAAKVKTPLSGLEDRKGYYAEPGASYVGLTAVDMLVGKSGFASLPAFWTAMGTGAKWQKAFATAFGETPEAFYAEYAKAIH